MDYIPSFRDSLYVDIQPDYTDSLMHFGIKGMKWGVRRYQNSDGSLTNQGKARYSSGSIFAKHSERKMAKEQAKKNRIANNLEKSAQSYKGYSKEFIKAANILQRDGIHGKSKYMQRLNEGDWSETYDGGPEHHRNFKNVISNLRDCSVQANRYSKVYSDAAKYLNNSYGVSYKDAIQHLNKTIYADARKKYGEDTVDNYIHVIESDLDKYGY